MAHQKTVCNWGKGKTYAYPAAQYRCLSLFIKHIYASLKWECNLELPLFFFSFFFNKPPAVPDNRRQAESLSLTREISQSRNPSVSEHLPDEKVQLFSKMRVLQEKKQKMDKLLGELHTLRDQHLNNSSCK